MELRILGALEVEEDGRLVRIAGAKQRTLLALLLPHANEPVPRDRLTRSCGRQAAADGAPGHSGCVLPEEAPFAAQLTLHGLELVARAEAGCVGVPRKRR